MLSQKNDRVPSLWGKIRGPRSLQLPLGPPEDWLGPGRGLHVDDAYAIQAHNEVNIDKLDKQRYIDT